MVNKQSNDEALRELALFAGAGGGILGGKLLGWRTVCAVERDAYAAQVLALRQNDGILQPFPIWSDVTTFDGKPWRGIVDIISGGFPCQDISSAGKGAGITGERSGLWKEFARIIGEVRPRFVFVENSPILTSRGLGVVLGDLAALGYDTGRDVISAADCGANHLRERIWIVGHAERFGWNERGQYNGEHDGPELGSNGEYSASLPNSTINGIWQLSECEQRQKREEQGHSFNAIGLGEGFPNTNRQRQQRIIPCEFGSQEWQKQNKGLIGSRNHAFGRWPTEPDVGRVANGVAFRVDRIKAIGNGQVPRVAATAFTLLAERAGIS